MAGSSGTGLGTTAWIVIAALATALGAGGAYMTGAFDRVPAGVLEPTALTTPATTPDAAPPAAEPAQTVPPPADIAADPAPDSGTDTPAEPDDPAVAPLAAPSFDVVRVDPDGAALIAGMAPAGSRVTLLLDAQPLDRVQADAAGGFVSFANVGFSDTPRVLTLRAERDGQSTESAEQIILAPLPAPGIAQLAEATPDPQGEQPQDTGQTGGVDPAEPPADQSLAQDASNSAPAPQAAPDPVQDPNGAAQDVSRETVTAQADIAADTSAQTRSDATAGADVEARAPATDPASEPDPAPLPSMPDPQEAKDQPAPQPPVAILRADADGVELIRSAPAPPPTAMVEITLETISYSAAGEVQLTGRAKDQSTVRVYFDNRAVADLDVDATGRWKGDVLGIAPGIYTLRLDELSATGEVLSRLETPFKREAAETLRPTPDPTETGQDGVGAPPEPPIRAVTVQQGDTLWAISRDRYGDGVLYVKLFDANRDSIRNPDLIYPGQVFAIPD